MYVLELPGGNDKKDVYALTVFFFQHNLIVERKAGVTIVCIKDEDKVGNEK